MIQANQLLENFRSLSPEKQAELVDFIEFFVIIDNHDHSGKTE